MKIFFFTFFFTFFLLAFLFTGCQKDTIKSEFVPKYSFFVAGHTYGNPNTYQLGLYPPFVAQFPYLNNYPKMELGVLTGDVVYSSTQTYWDSALVDIHQLDMPIHIAAGNHDRSPVFDTLFESYYSFKYQNDLFIILSPTNWNIEGVQKDFLIETLDDNSTTSDNIFIFCHELVWWAPNNIFGNVKINYASHYPGSTNYWSEINPILDALPNNVVIFAGDLGATDVVTPYMYCRNNNITLIGSGMGNGANDNIIIVEVNQVGEVRYKLTGIHTTTPYLMGVLEEYQLP